MVDDLFFKHCHFSKAVGVGEPDKSCLAPSLDTIHHMRRTQQWLPSHKPPSSNPRCASVFLFRCNCHEVRFGLGWDACDHSCPSNARDSRAFRSGLDNALSSSAPCRRRPANPFSTVPRRLALICEVGKGTQA